ncbi:MAG TPA: alpha/beta hydrolase [Bacteroidia bacterium]|jgi:proline iminopeptidase|nr:alpha/beta hydrolase [Bacteroidia bacterium]
MKKIIALFFAVYSFTFNAQTLFSNAFGDPAKPAIVFMHGGPGYNPVSFELGCANTLAAEGFFVITFDQRGCGRSKKDSIPDHYKFNKANDDINIILKKYNVAQAVFIGHSWGGTEAIKFAEIYPEKVKALILVGSPMNYQLGFKSIIQHCEEKFKAKKDSIALKQLAMVKKMDTTKLDYSSMCFVFAGSNGLYTPVRPSTERDAIYDEMKKSKKFEYVSKMSGDPVYGFFMNEQYTTLDMNYYVKKLIEKKIPVYAIYGKDDGLFNEKHFNMVKNSVGATNFILVDDASHNVFLDQRAIFVAQVKKWLTPPPEPEKKGKK